MSTEPSAPSPAGLRKMAVIGPSVFLVGLGIGNINLGLIFVLREVFGAPPSVVGWLGALWSSVYFSSCLAFRRLHSRLAPRTSMVFMSVSSAAVFLSFLAFPGIPAAFASCALFGLLLSFYWPPVMGWLARGLEERELSRASGIFSFSWSFSGILSPYMAGALSQRGKFLPVWFAVALLALNVIFLRATRRYLGNSEEPPQTSSPASGKAPDESTDLRYPAWAAVFVLYVTIGVLSNIFPMFSRSELGLSESGTGLMITVRTAATTIGFLFFGRFFFWRFYKGFLFVPVALSALFSLVLALGGNSIPVLVLGLAGMGFTAAWAYNNSIFYGASGAADRNRRMTIHEAVLNAGQVLGSLAGGVIYQAASMSFVFLSITALSLAGIGAQVLLFRRSFRRVGPPSTG